MKLEHCYSIYTESNPYLLECNNESHSTRNYERKRNNGIIKLGKTGIYDASVNTRRETIILNEMSSKSEMIIEREVE